jgi:hypothetical protein
LRIKSQSKHSPRTVRTHRSARALAFGARSGVRTISTPSVWKTSWVANWNENPVPFVWHKSAEEILERLAGYCATINEATGA